MNFFRRFWANEEGADAVEYALVIGLIALVVVAGATFLGGSISNKLSALAPNITSCTTGNTSC